MYSYLSLRCTTHSKIGCSLPLEVLELVVDDLDVRKIQDARSLASCTLVCKALLPHSSRRLFQRHILLDIETLKEFEAAIDTSYRLKAYTTAVIADISGRDPLLDNATVISAVHALRNIVGALPGLASLHVSGEWCVDDALEQWPGDAPPVAAHAIEDLRVTGGQVPLTNAVLGFFPAVDTLTVYEWPGDRYPAASARAHTVRKLAFEDPDEPSDAAGVLDVARLVSPQCLESLALGVYEVCKEEKTLAAINGLVCALGQHIAHVEIMEYNNTWTADVHSGEHLPLCVVHACAHAPRRSAACALPLRGPPLRRRAHRRRHHRHVRAPALLAEGPRRSGEPPAAHRARHAGRLRDAPRRGLSCAGAGVAAGGARAAALRRARAGRRGGFVGGGSSRAVGPQYGD